MDFHGPFDAPVMGHPDVGVASPDVCDDGAIFSARRQRLEQIGGRMAIVGGVGQVVEKRMGGSSDRLALMPKKNIPVPAEGRISRPLVARHRHEAPRLIELSRRIVEVFPERVRDLEVVPLMPADIQKRPVACKGEIFPNRVRADRFFRLSVKIAPIRQQPG